MRGPSQSADISQRRCAMEQAIASVGLEGLELSAEGAELAERAASGELTSEDLVQRMLRLHR